MFNNEYQYSDNTKQFTQTEIANNEELKLIKQIQSTLSIYPVQYLQVMKNTRIYTNFQYET